MTDQEFLRLKATMPWTEHSAIQGKQTLVKVLDRGGAEVPLLTIVDFVCFMSAHLARTPGKENKDA